ncbi:MAG: hypothetical protein HN948_02405 [Clostridia bacterium]|jgi:energy-coupling factor transporter ATP-binding protein EcfA2|nr:hypothetical protein [Clostridia bacterium]MBT7121843.1 hypothetical protein [Clostridia bacterium]
MKKITVLFGNYGSGKTELALNMALTAKQTHGDVTLVDLDIVNPYFRSSEHRAMLEGKGIRVIAPVYANTTIDVPSLPPEVNSAFLSEQAIFDCGGDAVGAAALGSLKNRFDKNRDSVRMLFVINTMRPFQQTLEQLQSSLAVVQQSARLGADGFVLNANLGKETTGEELVAGYKIASQLSKETGIPIQLVSGTQTALDVFKAACPQFKGEFFAITTYMRPDWMENT